MKKILMILTSHQDMENTDNKTGVWLGEFTEPYYIFKDKGYGITLASPAGGRPPVDPSSEMTKNITASNKRFQEDKEAQAKFQNTQTLSSIDPDFYDGIFIPGGHGPLWDLAHSRECGEIIVRALASHKPVAALCHGPAALLQAAELAPGLLENRKVTGFTNTEEAMVFRSGNIPYKLQTRLEDFGADFRSALIPYTPHVEVDGLIITGQNPASAARTAKEMVKLLEPDDREAQG